MWLIILGLGAVATGYAVKEHKAREAAEAYAAAQHAAAMAAEQALAERDVQDRRNPRPLMGMTPASRRRGHYGRYDTTGNYRRG